ncbi:MAG: RdgB/HAM1 family non-canonical purine NTP pyrophosphatase [Acidobacteria bacterium]|nr:RdgB/HAM1 family non-canonical purine NTP pyrophosphatase [Acidobacteriota bacterium]
MRRVVLATANPHKAVELTAMLEAEGFEVLPRPDHVEEVEENADTLEGNALLKAHAIARAAGVAAIADDTGLFVDALDGRPGVHSARFAGPRASDQENNDLLLQELAGHGDRRARFRTVIALVTPEGEETLAEGVFEGEILDAPTPGRAFGYDPLFRPLGESRSLAEYSLEEKNEVSHRARALRAFIEVVRKKNLGDL